MGEEVGKINWEMIESLLKKNVEGIGNEPIDVKKFSEGYSNLTYLIRIGEWEAVLRRPPFGPIPPKAHDMKREFAILEKMNPVFPLAPKPILFCEDSNVMERHFYVMEKKTGIVIDEDLPKEYRGVQGIGRKTSDAVVDTLVQLQKIDYKKAGLANMGHPDGYLERQVHGWIKRYHHCQTEEIPGIEALEKWLVSHIPTSPAPAIVHNDFKINNMMFSRQNPGEVVGVFDWEMCTIGDPVSDFGSVLAYWTEQGEETSLSTVTAQPGFVSRRELMDMYAKKSGRDLSNIDYYLTFAFYKVAVILQQIYYRYKLGKATDERFAKLGDGVKQLLKQAQYARNKEILK